MGLLRGQASAVSAFLLSIAEPSLSVGTTNLEHEALITEAREINELLSNVRFSDIVTIDEQAEGPLEAEEEKVVVREIDESRKMEEVEDMFAGLGVGTTTNRAKLTMDDVKNLKCRLEALRIRIGTVSSRHLVLYTFPSCFPGAM